MESKLLLGDCKDKLKELDDNSVDLMATDPPYGLSFMGKEWDSFNEVVKPGGAYEHEKGFKKLPRNKPIAMKEFFVPIWKECLRVLKPGGFAFVMAAPKQDVLRKQIETLEEAGFRTDFTSIYWTYATGFPKAMNIGKAVDKRLGKEREVIGKNPNWRPSTVDVHTTDGGYKTYEYKPLTKPATKQAKDLDGSYAGFQPKPAVEVVIVAMKPLDKKGYLEQAMDNGKGITWFDDCRIPFADLSVSDYEQYNKDNVGSQENFDIDPDGLSRGKQPSRKKTRVSAFGDPDQSETGDGRNLWGKKSTKIVEVDLPPTRKPKGDYEKYVEKQKSFKGAKTVDEVKEGGTTFLGGDMKQQNTAEVYQRKTTKRKPREEGTVFKTSGFKSEENDTADADPMGRFPANLLVSDDVLNDGKITKGWPGQHHNKFNPYGGTSLHSSSTEREGFHMGFPDEGSFSRYYSLDEWWKRYFKDLPEEVQKTFPFIIVPKSSKSEKNMGLDRFEKKTLKELHGGRTTNSTFQPGDQVKQNVHPTVKPVQLFSYLITLGSRKGDVVLDPFAGSGTTGISCVFSERKYILIERDKEYFKIIKARIQKAKNPANLVEHGWF